MTQPAQPIPDPADIIAASVPAENTRTGLSHGAILRAFLDNLFFAQGRFPEAASVNDLYHALAYTIRERLQERWVGTARSYQAHDPRTVGYLSAEYLPGPFLGGNLANLGIEATVREALAAIGIDLDALIAAEEEPGLGNGGLGRLAACYLDSLATLEIPAIGYGIRYEFGIFRQRIEHGEQVEVSDNWLRSGNPWEARRPHRRYLVRIGGHTEHHRDDAGRLHVRWRSHDAVCGVAYDTPILGHGVNTANVLRLWNAEAVEGFDFQTFNRGDYQGAVIREVRSETISKVLYPNDDHETGKRLRLLQQHFFVSCSLQDMLRIHRSTEQPLATFHEKFSVQLNDTHPAIAVAELMRLLVDEHELDWDSAWNVTGHTFAYTNHTLLPEAMEKWPVPLFENLLPRHLEIIYEINARFLDDVRLRFPYDSDLVRRMSIIDETAPRYVRMAHLACVGCFAINGVAELHTQLLQDFVLRDFHRLWPEKFQNKTNGVTPRRFLMQSNPELADLIREHIGCGWERDLTQLSALEPLADDPHFRQRWREVKLQRKVVLTRFIREYCDIDVDPASLFDVQVKRIHEYKRQHLNVLHIVSLYNRIKRNPAADIVPRSFVFGGKAAPGYAMAKRMIRLVTAVADVVNRDTDVAGRLEVVFLPNFSVKLGQLVYPAADLSEQISTAGKEASGTGNMKFALNGALTIGTLDGANVEIRAEVGAENFFLFGLTAEQVDRTLAAGYRPRDFYDADPELRDALDLIASGFFTRGDRHVFAPLVDLLLERDPYLLLADYASYITCQDAVAAAWRDRERWTAMSIRNVARSGKFSSDRAIGEYCRDIWRVAPLSVPL